MSASLNALRGRTTILVIAHCLHTTLDADHVVLLSSDGRVVDQGPYSELIGRCPAYREFWNSRRKAENWRRPSTAV
ncbi:hypothetical protein [Nocardiopsis chromatogenes]|uniref:hypothetical protein n=1 Tax=Nocardiopsis chromatogenes TaxID=280239 RepID=UPI00034DA5A0|nr:hypothetical protein [Nocardiopsis chromatogenes]